VLSERLRLHPIRMSSVRKERVLELVAAAGGRTLEVRDEVAAGGVTSSEYFVTVDTADARAALALRGA
jgi:hypothetical protein